MANDRHTPGELPIRSRRTYTGNGHVATDGTVMCPSRGQSLDVATCLQCHHCDGRNAATDALVCLHPAAYRPERPSRTVRMPSAAELTRLSEIMTGNVACVAQDVSIETLGTLMLEQNISAVPVVDAHGRPVGIASKTDLVRWYHSGADASGELPPVDVDGEPGLTPHVIPSSTVADVMMPMAFTLTEDAPIAYAATLMAVEGVHHLPVVTGDGQIVGIVSALDIVRWLAHHDGFVVPPNR
jgi:CBS domain-containing protein